MRIVVGISLVVLFFASLLFWVFGGEQCVPESIRESSCSLDGPIGCSVSRISTTEKATSVRLNLTNAGEERYRLHDAFLGGDTSFGPRCDLLGNETLAPGENVIVSCFRGGTIEQGVFIEDGFEITYAREDEALGTRIHGVFSGIVENPRTRWLRSC